MKKTLSSILCVLSLSLTACSMQSGLASTTLEMISDKVVEWTISDVASDNGDFSDLAFSADGKRIIAAFNSAALYWMDIENAEAILLDRADSCNWIGSDEVPSKLYKIAFKNL